MTWLAKLKTENVMRILGSVFLAIYFLVSTRTAMANASAEFRAGRMAKDSKTRKAYFQKGMDEARSILKLQGDSAEGLFWLAVNMGAEALERGKMSALPIVPQMERLLLKLDGIDPKYEDAGASRVLGRLYHQAPSVISVGSSEKAKYFLERALKFAPGHPGNQAFAADFLLEKGQDERAKKLAAACLKSLDASGGKYGDEAREWRELAQDVVDD